MRLFTSMLIVLLLLSLAASAQNKAEPIKQAEAQSLKSFDTEALDRTADPCVDFYQFACGNWVKKNPIPPDRSRWGRFQELEEHNQTILNGILQKAAVPDPKRDATDQKIGDYYASCMDEATIDKKGLAPLKPELDRIAAVKSMAELPEIIGFLNARGIGAALSWNSGQDFKDATQVIAQADQGGLGLPERDYYLKTDATSVQLREDYVKHVQRMLELSGEPPAKAATDAKTVMAIETSLAKVSMPLVDRRDPEKIYHKMERAQLQQLAPAFNWNQYFDSAKVPAFQYVNVAVPDFFKGLNGLIKSVPLDDWKTYLRWHVIHGTAVYLPKAFVDENFAFFGKELTGAKEIRTRWKRCVQYTDDDLGFALGQRYVELTFGAEGKQRTLAMVHALERALGEDIQGLDWMTPQTKKAAAVKLEHIVNKIGYPDKWRDYSTLEIVRGDAMGNSLRANTFEFNRRMSEIGKPVDRSEWEMTPPTVNAYYNPLMNDINFPAGILQPPFYSNRIDDAVNYGGIGAVIGHELTHGFDDQGSQFDANGDLRNWWTEGDKKAFDGREECFVKEYGSFTAIDDVHLNGKLTLGENTADNGGLRIALMALLDTIGGKKVPPVDGYTPEQRLFISWGQVWCQNQTPESLRLQAATDPHSPGKDRVNGVVQNMPEFRRAWGCEEGQPMAPANSCRVW
jgi:putative endopeptidase